MSHDRERWNRANEIKINIDNEQKFKKQVSKLINFLGRFLLRFQLVAAETFN